ncbi:MAG: protein kinase [Xanthomonadales bacterium]|nr:protein kinase [Xanthomonadales bacterium]
MEIPDIPGFRIIRELGSGGMATVFLAEQESLQREVALKVMSPGLAADEVACHRFVKEGKFIAKLSHPNLLKVFDTGIVEGAQGGEGEEEAHDYYFMACEYLPGGTVRERLDAGVDEEDALAIMAEAAAGLGYVHEQGIVHRDLKPGNLMFRGDGTCVLGDFGIAKAVNSNTASTKIGTSVGTPHYMSPEQAKGEKVDHRSDIYALGVLFYELLVGKPPFTAADPFSIALAQIQQPVPELPKKLSRYQPIIEKLMAKNRDERYQTAGEFLEDLKKLSAGKKAKPKPKPKSKPPAEAKAKAKQQDEQATTVTPAAGQPAVGSSPAKRRSRAPVWFALATVVVLAGVSGWLLYQKGAEVPADDGEVVSDPGSATETEVETENQGETELDQLLARAKGFLASKRFFAPANANAYEAYQQALRLDVTDPRAQDGLQDLLTAVVEEASRLRDAGKADEARTLVREGLRRFPADPQLTAILSDLGRADTPAQTASAIDRSEIERVLLRADRFYSNGAYDEATKLYRQILETDPDHDIANRKLSDIAQIWTNAAQSYLQEGNLDTAAGMIQKGLQARPEDPRLKALQERLESMRSEAGG